MENILDIDLLLKIVAKERQWEVFPDGAVFSTQQEELRQSDRLLRGKIDEAVAQNFPLKGSMLLQKYRSLVQDVQSSIWQRTLNQLQDKGKNWCQKNP